MIKKFSGLFSVETGFSLSLHCDLIYLNNDLKLQNTVEPDSFLSTCNTTLNEMAPLKQKHVRDNNSPFIKKLILRLL